MMDTIRKVGLKERPSHSLEVYPPSGDLMDTSRPIGPEADIDVLEHLL